MEKRRSLEMRVDGNGGCMKQSGYGDDDRKSSKKKRKQRTPGEMPRS